MRSAAAAQAEVQADAAAVAGAAVRRLKECGYGLWRWECVRRSRRPRSGRGRRCRRRRRSRRPPGTRSVTRRRRSGGTETESTEGIEGSARESAPSWARVSVSSCFDLAQAQAQAHSHALALSHVRLERLVLEEEGWTRTAERGWPWRGREGASAGCGGEALVVDAACGRTVRKAGAESSRRGLRTAQDTRRAIGWIRAR